MSNRDDFRQQNGRCSEGSETQRGSTSLVELFGQMMMFPLSVFVYGMELFVRTIQGVQKVADEGMTVLVGSPSQTLAEADKVNQIPGVAPGSESGLEGSLAISSTDNGVEDDTEKNVKETIKMNDTDLSDDMLKLVRYKILFVKRDYETAFPEKEEMVHDNMTGDAFAAWKVAEFIQRLGKEEVPMKWINKNFPKRRTYTPAEKAGTAKATINNLDEDDKKYLRVYFEVLARYEREEARHAEDQIKVLEDIRDKL